MLIFSRKVGETILLTGGISIGIHRITGNKVRVGVEAPKDVHILRGELEDDPADPHVQAILAEATAEANGKHFYAIRNRDEAECCIWIYQDASGQQCVSCSRGHVAKLSDFTILGPVDFPARAA
jgi:carbon storage regulator